MPFLLPHEWVGEYLILRENFVEGLPEAGTYMHRQLAKATEAWDSSPWTMFPLGLHGDGVPIQGRMNQDSCDFLSQQFKDDHREGGVLGGGFHFSF